MHSRLDEFGHPGFGTNLVRMTALRLGVLRSSLELGAADAPGGMLHLLDQDTHLTLWCGPP